MRIFSIIVLFLLIGCSPSYKGGDYAWIGCHIVTQNPSKEGAHAFSIGDVEVGHKIYFKEVSPDGTVGKVTTARPCKEGE